MRNLLPAALLMLCTVTNARAQRLDSLVNAYSRERPDEKIYLQLDKPVYAPGETVWFKAYLYSATGPSRASRNFYIDWTDAEGSALFHTVAPVTDGSAFGQFQIPPAFTGDRVVIHAYTRWMLNFDSAMLYDRTISIRGPVTGSVANSSNGYNLRFFPEGGRLAVGVPCPVAFKAVDHNGHPAGAAGTIRDSRNSVVCSFKTEHDGMGKVLLTPATGETYTASWKDDAGQDHNTPLPAADSKITLSADVKSGTVAFHAGRSPDAPEALQHLTLAVSMKQRVLAILPIDLSATASVSKLLPVQNLPSGILTLTLFDARMEPLAERACFINNQNYGFTPSVIASGKAAAASPIVLDIGLPDSVAADLSVSVTDAGIPAASNGLVSGLLLSADLRGYISNPDQYFIDNSEASVQKLDLVMLTHGWRRIDWEQVVSGNTKPLKYGRDTGFLGFYGHAPASMRGEKDNTIDLAFHAGDTSWTYLTLPIDKTGNFSAANLVLFDSAHLLYRPVNSREYEYQPALKFRTALYRPDAVWRNASAGMANPVPDTSGLYMNAELAAKRDELEKMLAGTTLKGVTVRTHRRTAIEQMDETYASGMFRGGDYIGFDIASNPSAVVYRNTFDYLREKVPALHIPTYTSQPTPSVIKAMPKMDSSKLSLGSMPGDEGVVTWRGEATAFFINEEKVELATVYDLPVKDIAFVKVFRPGQALAPFTGSGGSVVIYTKKGLEGETSAAERNSNLIIGYTPVRTFYSPDYASEQRDPRVKDLRTTLYWKPDIRLDAQHGKVQLRFYNNDVSKSYRVVLEGVNARGKLAHVERVVD